MNDKPLPEDEEIAAAHPLNTGEHALYAEAMRLIGAKHSKGALVDLVNWLLWKNKALAWDNGVLIAACEDRDRMLIEAAKKHPDIRIPLQPEDWVPLNPPVNNHDMRIGPCSCGAWHTKDAAPPAPTAVAFVGYDRNNVPMIEDMVLAKTFEESIAMGGVTKTNPETRRPLFTCDWTPDPCGDSTIVPEGCNSPATHISCKPFKNSQTCEKHKCRCAIPIKL